MKRLWILFLIPLVACNGLSTAPPSTLTVASVTPTVASPTAIPSTPTLTPTTIPNATAFPDPNAYSWQLLASGLERPVDLQADGSGRLFVIEKVGHIRIFQNGKLAQSFFLNITDRVVSSGSEQGLLGLAFHPNYLKNGYFFVNYTGKGGNTFISRFQVSDDPNIASPASEVNLLKVEQPFPNHNGGGLDFGPDGYLYAGLGDGGLSGDPFGNGQSTTTLLGKILRFDVDSAEPYAIPADNPLANEIWAYGLRNPWRISFDKQTGDLYVADVGQSAWEEVNFLPAGSSSGLNFGWDFYEGNHEYDPPFGGDTEYVFPVAEYSHAEGGCSVIGGYVYRGAMPEWNGVYLYGDYCTGKVWGLIKSVDGWQSQLLFDTDFNITSFGQDESGEIYLATDDGEVYKLIRK